MNWDVYLIKPTCSISIENLFISNQKHLLVLNPAQFYNHKKESRRLRAEDTSCPRVVKVKFLYSSTEVQSSFTTVANHVSSNDIPWTSYWRHKDKTKWLDFIFWRCHKRNVVYLFIYSYCDYFSNQLHCFTAWNTLDLSLSLKPKKCIYRLKVKKAHIQGLTSYMGRYWHANHVGFSVFLSSFIKVAYYSLFLVSSGQVKNLVCYFNMYCFLTTPRTERLKLVFVQISFFLRTTPRLYFLEHST